MQRGIIETACHDEHEQHAHTNGKIGKSRHNANGTAHKTKE